MAATPLITVYTGPGCHLCEEALAALRALQPELGFELADVDITADEELHRAYFERIPVVLLDGDELCEYFVDETLVRERLESRR
jgi:glutaredoxin